MDVIHNSQDVNRINFNLGVSSIGMYHLTTVASFPLLQPSNRCLIQFKHSGAMMRIGCETLECEGILHECVFNNVSLLGAPKHQALLLLLTPSHYQAHSCHFHLNRGCAQTRFCAKTLPDCLERLIEEVVEHVGRELRLHNNRIPTSIHTKCLIGAAQLPCSLPAPTTYGLMS